VGGAVSGIHDEIESNLKLGSCIPGMNVSIIIIIV
jgi:hypothetical protein